MKPTFVEAIATSTTAAYGKAVFYPGEVIRLVPTADMDIRLCKEFLPCPEMGRSVFEPWSRIWATDTENAVLASPNAGGARVAWQLGEIVTNVPILDKTAATLPYSHVLEFDHADLTDQIRCMMLSPNGHHAVKLPAESLLFSINHLQSTDTSLITFEVRKELDPTLLEYWTVGGSWGSSPVWNDVTGSATEAWESFLITPDAVDYYTVAIAPKDDQTDTTHISHVGLHQIVASGAGNQISDGVEYFYTIKERCRVGADMASSTGLLYVSRME